MAHKDSVPLCGQPSDNRLVRQMAGKLHYCDNITTHINITLHYTQQTSILVFVILLRTVFQKYIYTTSIIIKAGIWSFEELIYFQIYISLCMYFFSVDRVDHPPVVHNLFQTLHLSSCPHSSLPKKTDPVIIFLVFI